MDNKKIRIGITHGDICGVGYEVILKTFADPAMCDMCIPIVYGSPRAATYHRKMMDLTTNFTLIEKAADAQSGRLNMVTCFDEEVKITPGHASPDCGHAALLSLRKAVEDCRNGEIDALVTAPINKAVMHGNEFPFTGHTEYLEQEFGGKSLMILMNPLMRVALVTTHLPLREVPQAITQERIMEKAELFYQALLKDFSVSCPRIAVLSLNPHCGDGGLLGKEEEEVISPAVSALQDKGLQCYGPYAADGFFGCGLYKKFDGILAMYHDQGLAPFKALCNNDGVNYTAGLAAVRTSPAHGTAFDIAGKGIADENSFRQAVYQAIDVFQNRRNYEEAAANPLKVVQRENKNKHSNREQIE